MEKLKEKIILLGHGMTTEKIAEKIVFELNKMKEVSCFKNKGKGKNKGKNRKFPIK